MENDNISYKLLEDRPDAETITKLKAIYSEVFEDADFEFFEKRLRLKEDLLTIIALHDEKVIGFKIGYRYNEATFYSWLGGVLEGYRKNGVGTHLAELQEEWARSKGFVKLRTKSMNRFKPMMILNLRNGFNIEQVYINENGQKKVVFEKPLV